ncbi:hypothetical protein D9M70_379610 [compost metagenome]
MFNPTLRLEYNVIEVGDIAGREDTGHIRFETLVDHNAVVNRDVAAMQKLNRGRDTHRSDHQIGRQHFTRLRQNRLDAAGTQEARCRISCADIDPARGAIATKERGQLGRLKPRQKAALLFEQYDANAEAG